METALDDLEEGIELVGSDDPRNSMVGFVTAAIALKKSPDLGERFLSEIEKCGAEQRAGYFCAVAGKVPGYEFLTSYADRLWRPDFEPNSLAPQYDMIRRHYVRMGLDSLCKKWNMDTPVRADHLADVINLYESTVYRQTGPDVYPARS